MHSSYESVSIVISKQLLAQNNFKHEAEFSIKLSSQQNFIHFREYGNEIVLNKMNVKTQVDINHWLGNIEY